MQHRECYQWIYGPIAAKSISVLAESFAQKNVDVLFGFPGEQGRLNSYSNEIDHFTENCELKRTFLLEYHAHAIKPSASFINYTEELWQLLGEVCPATLELKKSLVRFVMPIVHGENSRQKVAFSSHLAKGIIFYSDRTKNKALGRDAIDLAHELGHQVLMLYLASDPMTNSDTKKLAYSGARKTKRPFYRSLHSAIALFYMIKALDRLEEMGIDCSPYKLTDLQKQFYLNITSLRESFLFTNFGDKIISEMESALPSDNLEKGNLYYLH